MPKNVEVPLPLNVNIGSDKYLVHPLPAKKRDSNPPKHVEVGETWGK